MGVREVLNRNPLEVAKEVLCDTADKDRRDEARECVELYLDDHERAMRQQFLKIFRAKEVRLATQAFADMASCISIYRRIIDEIARTVYSTPPARTLKPKSAQKAFNELARELRLNEKLDLAAHLHLATNELQLHPRLNPRLGPILDVITPNTYSVIPDPEEPTRALAVIYDMVVRGVGGRPELWYVYWDDAEAFRFDSRFTIQPIVDISGNLVSRLIAGNGHPGTLPMVDVHRRERWGTYHDRSSGKDLRGGQKAVGTLISLILRLHKTQGFKTWVFSGDVGALPRNQVLMEEGGVMVPEGGQAKVEDFRTDARHYLETLDVIITNLAANWGLNRARLNQEQTQVADAVGLLERRAEVIRIFRDVELRNFEKLKAIFPERIAAEAELEVDFAEISHKVDRKTLLEIRKLERSMGLRSGVDDVLEDQPEKDGDRDAALEEIRENMAEEAEIVKLRRKLNIPEDVTVDEPGQAAKDNGELGPLTRDGKITKDQAAAQARTGTPARQYR